MPKGREEEMLESLRYVSQFLVQGARDDTLPTMYNITPVIELIGNVWTQDSPNDSTQMLIK